MTFEMITPNQLKAALVQNWVAECPEDVGLPFELVLRKLLRHHALDCGGSMILYTGEDGVSQNFGLVAGGFNG